RQAVHPITLDSRQQVGLDLIVLAGSQDIARPGDEPLQRVRGPAELPLDQRDRQLVEATATEVLREVRGVKAGADGAAPDLGSQPGWNLVESLHQILVRDKLAAHELANGRNNGAMLVAKPEVHANPFEVSGRR